MLYFILFMENNVLNQQPLSTFQDAPSSCLPSSLPKPRTTKRALSFSKSKCPDKIESFYQQDVIHWNDASVTKTLNGVEVSMSRIN